MSYGVAQFKCLIIIIVEGDSKFGQKLPLLGQCSLLSLAWPGRTLRYDEGGTARSHPKYTVPTQLNLHYGDLHAFPTQGAEGLAIL